MANNNNFGYSEEEIMACVILDEMDQGYYAPVSEEDQSIMDQVA